MYFPRRGGTTDCAYTFRSVWVVGRYGHRVSQYHNVLNGKIRRTIKPPSCPVARPVRGVTITARRFTWLIESWNVGTRKGGRRSYSSLRIVGIYKLL